MEDKSSRFAERLKAKLAGSTEPVHADESARELVESQLDAASGGGGGVHISVHDSSIPPEGNQQQ